MTYIIIAQVYEIDNHWVNSLTKGATVCQTFYYLTYLIYLLGLNKTDYLTFTYLSLP